MVWILALLLAAAAVLLLWRLALRRRRDQAGWETLGAYRYAHRGLHDAAAGRPENSLSAFRAAAEAGFGAELDVHLLADGALAVVHDSDLFRVCGERARVEDLRREDLKKYPLLGSGETIPLLEDVLAVFAGKGPLIVELKAVRGNVNALTDAAMGMLSAWRGTYCVESFHPAVVKRLRKRWPDAVRGQLSQRYGKGGGSGFGRAADWAMTHLLICFAGRPDFIAYRWQDRHEPSLRLARRLWGAHDVAWTVRDRETMEALEAEGAAVIFEGFLPDSPFRAGKPGQNPQK